MKYLVFLIVATFSVVVPAFAQSTATSVTQPRYGVSASVSPSAGSGWTFDFKKSKGQPQSFGNMGSGLDLALVRDYGTRGDKGLVLSRKKIGNDTYVGGEFYSFMPFVGTTNGLLQFGPTIGVGGGAINGGFMPTGRADATLAIRTSERVKVKLGYGMNYPLLKAGSISAIYAF